MKPRFSLKLLLITVTAVALFCYWRTRPAEVARRFAAAIEAGDFDAADRLVKAMPLPGRYKSTSAGTPASFSEWASCQPDFSAAAAFVPQSAIQWLTGQSAGTIRVEVARTAGVAEVIATARGVEVLPFSITSSGSGYTVATQLREPRRP